MPEKVSRIFRFFYQNLFFFITRKQSADFLCWVLTFSFFTKFSANFHHFSDNSLASLVHTVEHLYQESPGQLACRENICKCANGIPSKSCSTHNSLNCFNCNPGYHLENGVCKKNVCICAYGMPATGTRCEVHDEPGCASKEANYFMIDNTFEPEANNNNNMTDQEVMARFQTLCQLSEACGMLPSELDRSCQGLNLLDGVYSVGVGFDGTQEYNLHSRRLPLIKHDCSETSSFQVGNEDFDIPATIFPQSNYQTKGGFHTFSSLDSYKVGDDK